MIILYKNRNNTVRFAISTVENMANTTATLTLGNLVKTVPASSKTGSISITSSDLSSAPFGATVSVLELKKGDAILQRLHVQTLIENDGGDYDNFLALTLVGPCNNQSDERYADIYECFLHDGTMYWHRSGTGTPQDPFVYSDPVIPQPTKIYVDAATGKWYRWNTELETPAYTEFGASSVTNTSQLENDGDDGVHPFLDTEDLEDIAASLSVDADWVSGRAYAIGDTCMHDGLWYECITANDDAEFVVEHWKTISVKSKLGISTTALSDGTWQLNFGSAN